METINKIRMEKLISVLGNPISVKRSSSINVYGWDMTFDEALIKFRGTKGFKVKPMSKSIGSGVYYWFDGYLYKLFYGSGCGKFEFKVNVDAVNLPLLGSGNIELLENNENRRVYKGKFTSRDRY